MSPPPENHRSFLSLISIRRNQIVSMDVNHEGFQKHVAKHFSELISPPPPPPPYSSSSYDGCSNPILSIQWLKNLLDVFISIETEFKTVLTQTQISKSPSLDRVLTETLDRILKALDICNAVINGINSVKQTQRLAEITVTALKKRPLCNGSVRRAKRALKSFLTGITTTRTTSRSWSFGQRSNVNKNWSATKQIQGMMTNLIPPRGGEASGLGMPIYIMSNVMVLVMWVLVAAVPCQTSNNLVTPLSLPKQQNWASAAVDIQERVSEVLKQKEKRCGGVMEEMVRMEKIGVSLMEFTERFRFPAEEEEKVAEKVEEMEEICRRMEVGLEDLQRQVKEVFHRLVKTRIEIISVLDQAPAI